MPFVIFTIAALCVCIGFSLALWLEYRSKRLQTNASDETKAAQSEADSDVHSELIHELFETLRELTAAVDDNVDRHSSRVAEITTELRGETANDAAFVVAAATQLLEANKQLKADLDSAKAAIRIQERELHSYMTESRTDELTGLANRRAFEEVVRRHLAQWHRQQIPLSLVLLDVDRFKWFNDFHGHQAGDVTLQQVATSLASASREMDLIARYGGEEFAVILNGTDLEQAKQAAERLRQVVLENPLEIDGNSLQVTVSAGVAQVLPSEDKKNFVKRVDDALYAAKNAGRNRGYYHDGNTCRPIDLPPSALDAAFLETIEGGVTTPIASNGP